MVTTPELPQPSSISSTLYQHQSKQYGYLIVYINEPTTILVASMTSESQFQISFSSSVVTNAFVTSTVDNVHSNIAQGSLSTFNSSCASFRFVFNSVVIGLLCVVGLTGNAISMVVLRSDRCNRVAVFLLRSLAVADSLTLVVALVCLTVFYGILPDSDPTAVLVARPYFIRFVHPVGYMAESATVWLTVLLGVNRYLSICRPFLDGRMLSMSGARLQVACVILLSVALNIPRIFQYDVVYESDVDRNSANVTDQVYPRPISTTTPWFPVFDENTPTTSIMGVSDDVTEFREVVYGETSTNGRRFQTVRLSSFGRHIVFEVIYTNALYTSLVLILPLFLLVVMNTKLIVELQKMRQRQRRNSLQCPQRRRASDDRKSSGVSFSSGTGGGTGSRENRETTVMVMIIIVLIVCHTPDRVVQLLKLTSVDQSWTRCSHVIFYASNVANFLIVLNSSTNFVIYYAFRRRFRQNLWAMLLCRETRPRHRFSAFEMGSAGGSNYNSSCEMSVRSRRTSPTTGGAAGGGESLLILGGGDGDLKRRDELTDGKCIIRNFKSRAHRSVFVDLSPVSRGTFVGC